MTTENAAKKLTKDEAKALALDTIGKMIDAKMTVNVRANTFNFWDTEESGYIIIDDGLRDSPMLDKMFPELNVTTEVHNFRDSIYNGKYKCEIRLDYEN